MCGCQRARQSWPIAALVLDVCWALQLHYREASNSKLKSIQLREGKEIPAFPPTDYGFHPKWESGEITQARSKILLLSAVPWQKENSSVGTFKVPTQGRPSLWALKAPPAGLLGALPCPFWTGGKGQACTVINTGLHQRTSQEAREQHTKWPASETIRRRSSKLHSRH